MKQLLTLQMEMLPLSQGTPGDKNTPKHKSVSIFQHSKWYCFQTQSNKTHAYLQMNLQSFPGLKVRIIYMYIIQFHLLSNYCKGGEQCTTKHYKGDIRYLCFWRVKVRESIYGHSCWQWCQWKLFSWVVKTLDSGLRGCRFKSWSGTSICSSSHPKD